jgi:hypothetical protein
MWNKLVWQLLFWKITNKNGYQFIMVIKLVGEKREKKHKWDAD